MDPIRQGSNAAVPVPQASSGTSALPPGQVVSARVVAALAADTYLLQVRGQTLVAASPAPLTPDTVVRLQVKATAADGQVAVSLLPDDASTTEVPDAPLALARQLGLPATPATLAVLQSFTAAGAPLTTAHLTVALAMAEERSAAMQTTVIEDGSGSGGATEAALTPDPLSLRAFTQSPIAQRPAVLAMIQAAQLPESSPQAMTAAIARLAVAGLPVTPATVRVALVAVADRLPAVALGMAEPPSSAVGEGDADAPPSSNLPPAGTVPLVPSSSAVPSSAVPSSGAASVPSTTVPAMPTAMASSVMPQTQVPGASPVQAPVADVLPARPGAVTVPSTVVEPPVPGPAMESEAADVPPAAPRPLSAMPMATAAEKGPVAATTLPVLPPAGGPGVPSPGLRPLPQLAQIDLDGGDPVAAVRTALALVGVMARSSGASPASGFAAVVERLVRPQPSDQDAQRKETDPAREAAPRRTAHATTDIAGEVPRDPSTATPAGEAPRPGTETPSQAAARAVLADALLPPEKLADYDRVVPLPLMAGQQPLPARLAVTTRQTPDGRTACWLRVDCELSSLGAISVRLSGGDGGPVAATLMAAPATARILAEALPALVDDLRRKGIDSALRVVAEDP